MSRKAAKPEANTSGLNQKFNFMRSDFKIPFEVKTGMKLTVISISDWMAHTMRNEIIITGEQNGRPTFSERGKRKQFYLDLKSDSIVLEGWNLPIKADTDSQAGFSGNACYNLVAKSPDELKNLLEKSLIPLSDDTKAKIIYISEEQFQAGQIHQEVLLYPDIETWHAVVNRIKEKQMDEEALKKAG